MTFRWIYRTRNCPTETSLQDLKKSKKTERHTITYSSSLFYKPIVQILGLVRLFCPENKMKRRIN